MNRFFKGKKPVTQIPTEPKQPEPRSMDEIQKVYAELCARAGSLQYKITIEQRDLEQLNKALESINNEAAARQKLDEPKKEETK